jgi:signal transduction histidine kinase
MSMGVLLLMMIFSQGNRTHALSKRGGPVAKMGILDLSDWDFIKDGRMQLKGEWEFYWNALLAPEDFKEENVKDALSFIKLPTSWSKNYPNIKPAMGYATFRLQIKSKPGQERLALQIPLIESAYKIWVNDRLINEKGRVASTKEEAEPFVRNGFEVFDVEKEVFYLTIQVSNYSEANGGMPQGLELGNFENMAHSREFHMMRIMMIFGLVMALTGYHFMVYFFSRRDKSTLLLAFLTACLGSLNYGLHNYPMAFFPEHIGWVSRSKALTILICGISIFAVYYIKSIFPKETNEKYVRWIGVMGIVHSVLVLLMPLRFLGILIVLIQIMAVITCVFCAAVGIKALIHKREGSWLLFGGFFVIISTIVNDILYHQNLIHTQFLTSYGIAIFILANTLLLAIKYSKSFHKIEALTEELMELDRAKDLLVLEKTKSLRMLLDNADQGFLSFFSDLLVSQDYSLECVRIFSRQIENESIPELLYPNDRKERETLQKKLADVFQIQDEHDADTQLKYLNTEIELNDIHILVVFKLIELKKDSEEGTDIFMQWPQKEGKELKIEEYGKGDGPRKVERDQSRRVMAILSDVTEKKALEKQMIQSEKIRSLGELVSGVAHEINTPIGVSVTAISSQGSKILDMKENYTKNQIVKKDFEQFLEALGKTNQIVASNLHRASDLIQNFKKVSVDMSHEEKRIFKVKEYLESILFALSPRLKKSKIEIQIFCDEELEVFSFPGALSQIFTNFIMNSLNHAFGENEEGGIWIEAFRENKKLVFVYRDNGKGILKEHLDKIFDPFFTTKRGSGGTGLGLNIVYNIVNMALKGSILCISEPFEGAKFVIKIPAYEE